MNEEAKGENFMRRYTHRRLAGNLAPLLSWLAAPASASWFAQPPSQQMALLVRLDRQRPPPISPSDIHHKWCSPWVRYWPLLLPACSSSVPLLPLLARIFW